MPAYPLSPTTRWATPRQPGPNTLANMAAGLRARKLLFAGAALIGAIHLATSLEGATPFEIRFGTVQIYLFDILALVLGSMGAVLSLRRRQLTWVDGVIYAILIVSVGQFIRGYIAYDTQAGVEFRQDAFVLGGLLFMLGTSSYYRHSRRDFLIMLAFFVGAGLIIYAARALGLASLNEYNLRYNVGTWRASRFITPDEAFGFIAFSLAALSIALRGAQSALDRRSDNVKFYWLIGFGALLLSLIAMHRSVWAVALISVPLFYILQPRYRLMSKQDVEPFIIATFVLCFIVTTALLTSATLQNAISEVSAIDSSFSWRTEGWERLVALLVPQDYAMGRGYGADYSRWVFGSLINYSAHNFYLEKLWQLGAAGLALYIVLYFRVVAALATIARRSADAERRALAALLLPLVCGELVFFIVYANWIQSVLILGYALGFVRTASIRAPRRQRRLPLFIRNQAATPRISSA